MRLYKSAVHSALCQHAVSPLHQPQWHLIPAQVPALSLSAASAATGPPILRSLPPPPFTTAVQEGIRSVWWRRYPLYSVYDYPTVHSCGRPALLACWIRRIIATGGCLEPAIATAKALSY